MFNINANLMNFADIGKFQSFQVIKGCESFAPNVIHRLGADETSVSIDQFSNFGKIDIRDCPTYYFGKNFAVCSAV